MQPKTLHRYTTQKNNILIDYPIPNGKGNQFYSQHNQSVNHKSNHTRQSRDRYQYNHHNMTHQKIHSNKQNNFNMDNTMHH